MKRETRRVLTYLLLLLTWLAQSQQSCINRFNKKTDLPSIKNENSLELITRIRRELNAEKRRVCRDCNPETFLGSNLFDGIRKKCFSSEDISLLTARSQFQMMIPEKMPPKLLTDKQISWIIHFFCYGHFLVDKLKDNSGNNIVKRAFYDTLGGFLHHYLIPIARASFYAGRVKVGSVLKVIAHYEKCRRLLNTNGNGWRAPISDPLKHLRKGGVRPLNLKCSNLKLPGESPCACEQLDLQSGASVNDVVDDSMIVSLPRIEIEDSDGFLGNMYVPFERKRTFNLRSPKSVYVLVDFFKTVNACYNEKNKDPKVFNTKLKDWIVENVQPHLNDEMFYPGLGRVLNLYETLRQGDKKPELKKRSQKKKKKSYGDRMKRCREDLNEALLQHRRKTLKYINLESKAQQDNFECENNWLKDPLVTGVKLPRPKGCSEKKADNKDNKKKSKWFGKSKKEKDGGKKKEKDDGDSKRKSKWGLGNWYKKGSWGFVFPKLEGLGLFGKIGEILKFIFFVILAIFLFWLIFKILMLSCTLCAGASPCIKILLNTLYQFGKLLLKVLVSLCSCLPCLRQKGGRESDTNQAKAPMKELVLPGNEKIQKNKKGKMSKKEVDELMNKVKEVERSKKDKKSKSMEPLPPPPLDIEKLAKDDKKSKKEKKEKNKTKAKKSKKEKKSKNVEPTSSDEESPIKESAKKSKKEKKKSKKENVDEAPADKLKTDKKSKKSKKSKAGDESQPPQNESLKDDKSDGSSSPPKRKRTTGKERQGRDRKSKRQGGGSVDRSDDSSERLLGGRSNAGWSTCWKMDPSSQDDCDGKASWKTFYDF